MMPHGLAVASCAAVAMLMTAEGVAGSAPGASACQPVSAPMVDVPAGDSEPQLKVPLPRGWQISPALDPTNDSIRMAILNPELTAAGFTPNAVVVLKKVGADAGDAEQILNAQREFLLTRGGAEDLSSALTEICGLPAMVAGYTAPAGAAVPPRSASTLVVVDQTGAATFVATVTIQAVDPSLGSYPQDERTIVEGFQMLPST